jgi:hypothetical protein
MPYLNPKYRVSRRFEGEISQIRTYRHVKEWSNERNLRKVRFQDGSRFFSRKFLELYNLRSPTTLQRDLARCTGVSHPTDLAVGSDKPALLIPLHECYRR